MRDYERLIYMLKPLRLLAMSQKETVKAIAPEALSNEELATLNALKERQAGYTMAISSGLVNNAPKHIVSLADRLDKVIKAKNNGKDGKPKANAKHNLCLNLVTNKMPIMSSGTFNIQVTVWITSKSTTPLSHKEQAREFYQFLDGKGLGVSFEQFFASVEDRFTQSQQ